MSKFVNRFACIVALCAACVLPMEAQAADKSAKDLGRAKKAVQTVKKEASVKLKDTRFTASIAWLQSSAEYKALCYQTYNMAAQAINDQIRLGSYVRVNGKLCEETLERTEDGKLMRIYHPLAIVLDVDETVEPGFPPEKIVEKLARRKAHAVFDRVYQLGELIHSPRFGEFGAGDG